MAAFLHCNLGSAAVQGATLTVTYSEDFYGVTITATNGVTTSSIILLVVEPF